MRALAMLAAACAVVPTPAIADSPERTRPVHGSVGVGGYFAITGPATAGLAADVEVYPGGALGRYGFTVHARELERGERALITTGVGYEVGASRPRLALSLRADIGATFGGPTRPVVGVGLRATLAVIGPVALGATSSTALIYDGVDSSLVLASVITLGLAR